MGGEGRNYSVPAKSLAELEQDRKNAEAKEKYEVSVNQYIQDLLREINERDVEGINRHLETIKTALEKDIEGFVELRFGGSIIKHTYAQGLSDVDMLVQINNSKLSGASPTEVLSFFCEQIKKRLPRTEVSIGDLGITVKFTSGHEIQLLPSIKTESGYRIARPRENRWSNVIRPDKFAKKLTDVNQANSNKVVPLIKIIKKINASLPAHKQLSGYHIESLAIDAFKKTSVPKTYKGMVEHFFRHSEKAVITPIKDNTGQSLHVDNYLGEANSAARQKARTTLRQIIKRFESADSKNSLDLWKRTIEDK